jgi:hypothetical protein
LLPAIPRPAQIVWTYEDARPQRIVSPGLTFMKKERKPFVVQLEDWLILIPMAVLICLLTM